MTTFLTAPRPSGLASLPADLSSCPAGVNQIIIRQVDYAHDHFMNLEQQAKNIAGAQATEAFTYDELQRIKSGTRSWVYQGLSMSEGDSYTYDDLGNITSKSDYASVYTYGTSARSTRLAGPHAVVAVSGKQSGSASATFTYDWNGNLVDGDGRTIDFDLLDRPVRVARSGAATDFAYAPDGARYRLRISGAVDCVFGPKTVYYVDKDYEVTVWAPCGARTSSVIEERSYLGGSVVVYRRDANPREVRYEHKDRLGSLDAVTKDDPAATELYVDAHGYDPFGKPRARDWTPRAERLHPGGDFYATTDRGFTGHEHLDLHYLIHMNGRVYDYRLGRFLSVDPIISDPANSQSINPYSYIGNNPLSGTDPTGYEACGALVEGCSGLRSGPQAAGARPSLTESELGNHVQTIVITPQESGATGQGSQQSNAAIPEKNSPGDTAKKTSEDSNNGVLLAQARPPRAAERLGESPTEDLERTERLMEEELQNREIHNGKSPPEIRPAGPHEPLTREQLDARALQIAKERTEREAATQGQGMRVPGPTTWGNPQTLADHFARHGADFGAKTPEEYVQAAARLFERAQRGSLPTKIDPKGVIRVYDPATNSFGAFNPNGTIRTFCKPDPAVHGYPTNLDYWNAQKGLSP